MPVRDWLRHVLGCLTAGTLMACAHVPATAPALAAPTLHAAAAGASASGRRPPGTVDENGWHGVWLPTMNVLSLPSLDWISPLAAHAADDYVHAHNDEWRATLAAMAPEDRTRAAVLLGMLLDRPLGAAALMHLAHAGTLTAPAARAGQPTVLASLDAIAHEPLGRGIDRAQLLAEAAAELEVPGRTVQGVKWTCEAASTQVLLAERDPAEYARLVAGLAAAPGTISLADGSAIARVPDWASNTDGWRSTPGRLLQPAFAVLGNAPLSYDNTHDRNSLGQSGLTDPQLAKLLGCVFATPFVYLSPENSTDTTRMAAYVAAIAAGWHPPVWLDWFGGHVVLAEPEREHRVVIDNPLGAIHSLAPGAFASVLHSVYVPAPIAAGVSAASAAPGSAATR